MTTTFELLGLKKQDVKINNHNSHLTVYAEGKLPEMRKKGGYVVCDPWHRRISRSLQLPQGTMPVLSLLLNLDVALLLH